MISDLLNRTLEHWRPTSTGDGMGGVTQTTSQVDTVRAKVDQPSAAEQQVAAQEGAALTHNVYLLPDVDVRRDDEFRETGRIYRVLHVVEPSEPIYVKAQCERIQTPEG